MTGKHLAIGIGFVLAAIGAALLPNQTLWTESLSTFGLAIGGWLIGFVTGSNLDEDGYVRLNENPENSARNNSGQ